MEDKKVIDQTSNITLLNQKKAETTKKKKVNNVAAPEKEINQKKVNNVDASNLEEKEKKFPWKAVGFFTIGAAAGVAGSWYLNKMESDNSRSASDND